MKKNNINGFSMIELLISMAIFSILAGAIGGVYVSTSRTSTLQNASAGVQQSVRAALEIMVQDIRMAGYYNPTGADPNPASIEFADLNKIRITSDRNGDGDVDDLFERITYEFTNNQLRQILYEGTGSQSSQTIIDNVTDPQFTYFDSNNNPTNNISKIVSVDITLTVEENAGYGNTVSRTLETRVYCRNLDIN